MLKKSASTSGPRANATSFKRLATIALSPRGTSCLRSFGCVPDFHRPLTPLQSIREDMK